MHIYFIRPFLHLRRLPLHCLLLCLLCSCASYQSRPLPHDIQLKKALVDLQVDTKTLHFRELASHPLDLQGEWDITNLATLAVLNNPELKLARDEAGIVHAQAFAAGLLPDPQINLSRDLSNSAGANGSKAFGYGLSFDIGALWTHSAMVSAANAESRKTDLNALWQEWQVIAQARLLYVKLIQNKKLLKLLNQNIQLYSERLTLSEVALEKKLLLNDTVLSNLTSLQDLQKQTHEVERQLNQTQQELHALLGMDLNVELRLRDDFSFPAIDEKQVKAALLNIAVRRADLMALDAAYQAQDQRYRAAIQAQFPALNIGLTHAGDASGVYSNGVGLTLSLPLLNRNRGNIAIELATRQKLYDEYQQRLRIARSDIEKILSDQAINQVQLREVEVGLSKLTSAAQQASIAYQHKHIDAFTYMNVRVSLLSKQVEEINLQQMMMEQRVALQTLIGGDLPVLTFTESQIP